MKWIVICGLVFITTPQPPKTTTEIVTQESRGTPKVSVSTVTTTKVKDTYAGHGSKTPAQKYFESSAIIK